MARVTVAVRITNDEVTLIDGYAKMLKKSRTDILNSAISRLLQDYQEKFGLPKINNNG